MNSGRYEIDNDVFNVSGIEKQPAGCDIYLCRQMEIWETALKTIV